MEIPGLGGVTKHAQFDWYYSDPMPIPVLGGKACRIVVDRYENDSNKGDYHAAIANLIASQPSVLRAAEPHVYKYYQRCNHNWDPSDDEYVAVETAAEIWQHVQFGDELMVTRRAYGDKGIYISLECGCDWEPEHGLQIVFKNGERINKIGPFNGHVTNSDAYDDDGLEDVVYPYE